MNLVRGSKHNLPHQGNVNGHMELTNNPQKEQLQHFYQTSLPRVWKNIRQETQIKIAATKKKCFY